MKENSLVRTGGCELCLYKNMEKYELDYIHKRQSVIDIIDQLSKELDMRITKYKFYNHMKMHLNPEVAQIFSTAAPKLADEVIDKTGELIDLVDTIKGKVEGFDHAINASTDPSTIRAYTGLVSELRHLIEALAKIQGEYKGSGVIHAKNVNIEYNNVIAQVLQDACHVCKAKFAKTLEPLILKKIE